MLRLEILEGRQLLAGTVMAEIDSYPSQVLPGQIVDVTVRLKFTGDDNDGPWLVTDLDLRDDDDGISSNNDDPLNIYQNIRQKDGPLTILNQGEWYYNTFQEVDLSTFDDGGDGIELFVFAEVDDNDFNGFNPDGASSNYRIPVVNSGPRITAQTPAATTTGSVSYIEVTFSEAISVASFMPEDVVLTKSGQQTSAISAISQVNGNTYRISLTPPLFLPGNYMLVVGPNITDTAGNLMNQDHDNSNGETTGDRYSGSFTIASETNKYSGTIVADVGINNLDEINVYLQRVGGSPIASNLQTWLVIHGRQEVTSIGHGASTMESLAVAVDAYRSTDQVLLLDWTQGSSDNHFPEFLDGASWITHVASWTRQVLSDVFTISASQLFLVGHSWGTYVAYELASLFPQSVKAIVALDPASGSIGYPNDEIDFSAVSERAWAFYGDGLFGGDDLTGTADEAFVLAYDGGSPGNLDRHTAPRLVFETLVRDTRTHQVGNLLSLARLEGQAAGPWILDQLSDTFLSNSQVFEARLLVRDVNQDNDWGEVWADIIGCSYVDTATGMPRTIGNSALTPLLGDYNFNGSVDAADYIVWRNSLGQSVPPFSGADGDYDGNIDQGDFAVWRANFGRSAAAGNAAFLADASSETKLDVPTGGQRRKEKSGARTAAESQSKSIPLVATPKALLLLNINRGMTNSLAPDSRFTENLAIDARLTMLHHDRRRNDSSEKRSWHRDSDNAAIDATVESLDLVFNRIGDLGIAPAARGGVTTARNGLS